MIYPNQQEDSMLWIGASIRVGDYSVVMGKRTLIADFADQTSIISISTG